MIGICLFLLMLPETISVERGLFCVGEIERCFMTTQLADQDFDAVSFFEDSVQRLKESLQEIEKKFAEFGPEVEEECVQEFTRVFHQSREECRSAELQLKETPQKLAEIQKKFRDELAPWFDQSWYFDRAKQKPRGYPGDFVMLTALYDKEIKSQGIGRIMDQYFLQADLARAVRTRLAAVKDFVIDEVQGRDGQVAILNVASGPGREYADGFENVADHISLTCIDSDADALQHLKEHLDPSIAEKLDLKCVVYNALKTRSAEANLKNFGQIDIIYSVGLCDYIPDTIMIKILEGWRQTVAPGGVVYVAFKDSEKYVESEYQWHADWHFFQRTEAECRELFAAAGYDMLELQMFRDETDIIMNFVSRAPVLDAVRRDYEQAVSGPHVAPAVDQDFSESDSFRVEE